jgi:prevent-host-death family protein
MKGKLYSPVAAKIIGLIIVPNDAILYEIVQKKGETMSESQPITEVIQASEARQQWSQLLNKVFRGEMRVLVEKSGIPVAAIISAEDLKRLKQLEAERAERFAILDEIQEAFKDVPTAELEREVAKAIHEVREEGRADERDQHPLI